MQHLHPVLQTLGPAIAGANIDVTTHPATDPFFIFVNGAKRAYVEQTFTVPAGADHLDAAIAYPPANNTVTVWLGLIQSGSITVSITPDASKVGGIQSGWLDVDTFDTNIQSGDEMVRASRTSTQ